MSSLVKIALTGLITALLLPAAASASGPDAAAASASGPEAYAARECSTRGIERKLGASYVTQLSTRRVTCADARSFSRLYHRCRRQNGGRRGRCRRVRRFRCSERRFNVISISFDSKVLCTRGSQRIRQTYTQLT